MTQKEKDAAKLKAEEEAAENDSPLFSEFDEMTVEEAVNETKKSGGTKGLKKFIDSLNLNGTEEERGLVVVLLGQNAKIMTLANDTGKPIRFLNIDSTNLGAYISAKKENDKVTIKELVENDILQVSAQIKRKSIVTYESDGAQVKDEVQIFKLAGSNTKVKFKDKNFTVAPITSQCQKNVVVVSRLTVTTL